MKVNYMLGAGAYAPAKSHKEDAGFDLRTPRSYTVMPHSSITVDTGIHIEIPTGYVGMVKSKSGLNVKHNLVAEGVIDAGYTGSIVVKMYNNGNEPYYFQKGDKITQLVILPIPDVELCEVDALFGGDRGINGFGSTGK